MVLAPRLHHDQAVLAAKNCAALVVGYGLALGLDWKASSVATTILVLQAGALGATLNKALLRIVGTIGGAVAGLVLAACFAHDRELFILAMALLTGFCVWAMQRSTNVYAWMMVVLTAAVVGWPDAMNPLNAFQSSVNRISAVLLGVILSAIANGIFWPATASKQFEQGLRDLLIGCRELLQLVRLQATGKSLNEDGIARKQSQLMATALSLKPSLDTACSESRRLADYSESYHALCDAMVDYYLATAAICDAALLDKSFSDVNHVDSESSIVGEVFDDADKACEANIRQLALPRDGTACPKDVADESNAGDDDNQDAANQLAEESSWTSLLMQRLLAFKHTARRMRSTLSVVESRAKAARRVSSRPAGPAPWPRLKKALLASLQVVLAAYLIVLSDWPLGLQSSMILVMVFAFLNAQLPVALLLRPIVTALALAPLIGAVFHFYLMPRLDAFVELAPLLFLFYAPFMYVMASRRPMYSYAAMLGVIIMNILVSISTEPPSYTFSSYVNTYIGLCGGFGVVLFLAQLFETRIPRRLLHRVIVAALQEGAKYLGDLRDSTDESKSLELTSSYRNQALTRLAQIRKLTATVKYGVQYGGTQTNWKEVTGSIEILVMRLVFGSELSVGAVSTMRRSTERANGMQAWCITSLHEMQGEVSSLERVPDDPPRAEPQDVSEGGLSSSAGDARSEYDRTLVDAIVGCRTALSAINWRRWTEAYF